MSLSLIMPTYQYTDSLESTRLRTRFLTPGNIKPFTVFFEDEECVEFIKPFLKPTAEESTHYMVERQMQRYAENRYGLQALFEKKTNAFIGACGLLLQEVDGINEVEVGYHMLKKYWGQGYAPEAARIFLDYAFQNKLAESIISVIDINNVKSQRVAEKNGLVREKQTRWHEMDVFIYRIRMAEWK
ncbi:MAG: GNAT family N-acetyltransferase [Flavobacteriales bacterium]